MTPQCTACGKFVRYGDPQILLEHEPGDYGTILSSWIVRCSHCRAGPMTGSPRLRFCYADPPYVGQARKHYAKEAAANGRVAAEVDYGELIIWLAQYDGWALSLSSPSLKQVLRHCGNDVRVGAWVKPFASFKPNVNPGYCWEPVIFWGGRRLGRNVPTVRDYVSANITLKRGVSGAKPEAFCLWLFQMLGMERDDEFVDLFPGSGAVTKAWEKWRAQTAFATHSDLPGCEALSDAQLTDRIRDIVTGLGGVA